MLIFKNEFEAVQQGWTFTTYVLKKLWQIMASRDETFGLDRDESIALAMVEERNKSNDHRSKPVLP